MSVLLRRIFPPATGRAALERAARVAIVAPAVLALGELVLGNSALALFGIFGSFAMLVFVDFGGPPRARLRAYLALGAAGVPLIALATVCSQSPWVAAATMALLAFAIIFAGVISGYIASATNAALLAFVLAVMVPAPASAIPDRVAGWSIAAVLCTAAALLIWPNRPLCHIHAGLAAACRALAASLRALSNPDGSVLAARAEAAERAVTALRRSFAATPYRPTGPLRDTAALARLVADVGWIQPLAMRRPATSPLPVEAREIESASAEMLTECGAALAGQGAAANLTPLDRIRNATRRVFSERLTEAAVRGDDRALAAMLEEAFRLRTLSAGAREISVDAMLAAGRDPRGLDPAGDGSPAPLREALRGATGVARGQASPRSIWLRNSVRGAIALGLAVLVGQLADVQHGFWVVLGTLSVLRSNALGTGGTVLRALAGTAVGIVVAGALLLAIDTDAPVAWAILPFAVLFASYAPRAISFAAGQAGFTIAILLALDLIQPAGWQAGLVRLEDIAIGAAVSLAAGLLFWPRGAATIVRESLATAYSAATAYLIAAVNEQLHGGDAEPVERAERDALDTRRRLDLAIRQYLAERSTARLQLDDLGVLVAGVSRVRRAGDHVRSRHALLRLDPEGRHSLGLAAPRRALELELEALRDWYGRLAMAILAGNPPPTARPDPGVQSRILHWAREPGAAGRSSGPPPGLAIAWLGEHIDDLRVVEPRLVAAAGRLARQGGAIPAGRRSGPP